MKVTPFDKAIHNDGVVALWSEVFGYGQSRNDPQTTIDQKVATGDGLFFVAEDGNGKLQGTVMCGYDGHRGWIYSLAVQPSRQGGGIGSALMKHAEKELANRGCMKVNLQIVANNSGVQGFYEALGFQVEERISMGKEIEANLPKEEGGL